VRVGLLVGHRRFIPKHGRDQPARMSVVVVDDTGADELAVSRLSSAPQPGYRCRCPYSLSERHASMRGNANRGELITRSCHLGSGRKHAPSVTEELL
jgi:hypothetical protein